MRGSTTTTLASSITYKPFGRMTSYVAGNGTTSSRSYDLDYRISTLSTSNSLQNLSYDWDAADSPSHIERVQ